MMELDRRIIARSKDKYKIIEKPAYLDSVLRAI
jgi:hypothetical protein